MTVQAEMQNGLCSARIAGEMNIYAAAELKERFAGLLEDSAELELNLSEVKEIDTAGVQLLLLLKREAQRTGKAVRFTAHSDVVREVIELYNLANYFGDPLVLPAERA